MGMGFQSISIYQASPVFQTLISEGILASPVFGFKLASSGSELSLGGVAPGYHDDDFTWIPLSNAVCLIFTCVICVSNACFSCIGLLAGILR